jgi:hypothetical protein
MKILLEYDPVSGQLTDAKGMFVTQLTGLVGFEQESSQGGQLKAIKELIAAGVTVDEVLKLKREGVI